MKILVTTMLVALAVPALAWAAPPAPGKVDGATAKTLAASGAKVVDVRTAEEFGAGHIPGSVFMPLFSVPLRLSELSRRHDVFVVCESGARGQQASEYLDSRGYRVRNLAGGMGAWRASGMQVRTGMDTGVFV